MGSQNETPDQENAEYLWFQSRVPIETSGFQIQRDHRHHNQTQKHMIKNNQIPNRVRHSVYWYPETKKLLEKKSEELQVSQNKLTELCLQKYLPKMRLSWS